MTPLQLAIGNDEREAFLLLLEQGVDVNEQDEYGQTALHIAIDMAFEDAIQRSDEAGEKQEVDLFYVVKLIQHNADPNIKDSSGKSPIDWVYDRSAPEVVERIMKAANNSDHS